MSRLLAHRRRVFNATLPLGGSSGFSQRVLWGLGIVLVLSEAVLSETVLLLESWGLTPLRGSGTGSVGNAACGLTPAAKCCHRFAIPNRALPSLGLDPPAEPGG